MELNGFLCVGVREKFLAVYRAGRVPCEVFGRLKINVFIKLFFLSTVVFCWNRKIVQMCILFTLVLLF